MARDYMPIEEMEVLQRFVQFADWVWQTVSGWPDFAKDTVGRQFVRAADSVGANLVEGDGRYSDPDAVRFFVIARASAREARYWLHRANTRALITPDIVRAKEEDLKVAARLLNSLIRYRRTHSNRLRVRESALSYGGSDGIDPLADRS